MTDLPEAAIDRNSPAPFYFQLAQTLEGEITSGRWPSGTRRPSEPEMCEHFGLSRTTVRQALARLEQRGLIERLEGQGTFVQRTEAGLWLLQSSEGFFQDGESVAWDSEMRPFDCYRAWLRTDRTRIDIQVSGPQGATSEPLGAGQESVP